LFFDKIEDSVSAFWTKGRKREITIWRIYHECIKENYESGEEGGNYIDVFCTEDEFKG
jgi:hypothetical protein